MRSAAAKLVKCESAAKLKYHRRGAAKVEAGEVLSEQYSLTGFERRSNRTPVGIAGEIPLVVRI